MRLLSRLIVVCSVLGFAACGDDGGDGGDSADAGPDTFTLTLGLNGYGNAHDGDTLYFSLWDDADSSAPVATDTFAVMSGGGGGGGGGGNMIEMTDALVDGRSYTLYWYADLDVNTTCDMGSDHHWSIPIANVIADADLTHMHTTTFNGDCTKQ